MYNEIRVIADTAKRLSEYMAAHFEEYEILFCSDGSTDGCDEAVRALELPNVRVIAYSPNRGKGCAVRTAMLAAEGDVRMFTDADLAYGTDVIAKIADTFAKNPDADLVIGSRNLDKSGYEGYTFVRRVASKTYIKMISILGGFRLSDSQCGCKAFSAKAAEEIFSRCETDGFAFDLEAILWATKMKYRVVEIPVRVLVHGESKVRIVRDTFRMLADMRRIKKRIHEATMAKVKL
jgi:dolichyl-phosphate beta-glucosyltransferase